MTLIPQDTNIFGGEGEEGKLLEHGEIQYPNTSFVSENQEWTLKKFRSLIRRNQPW